MDSVLQTLKRINFDRRKGAEKKSLKEKRGENQRRKRRKEEEGVHKTFDQRHLNTHIDLSMTIALYHLSHHY